MEWPQPIRPAGRCRDILLPSADWCLHQGSEDAAGEVDQILNWHVKKSITGIILSISWVLNAQVALPTFQGTHFAKSSGSQTFSYTGSQQTFTVPAGVSTITIKVWGAQGGNSGYYSSSGNCATGGKGGYSTGTLSVSSGNTVYIYVGGQGEGYSSCSTQMQNTGAKDGGWNGGGGNSVTGPGGTGGGGASDVRYGGTGTSNRKIVGGGGGGGGNAENSTRLSNGGAGGGTSGQTMATNTQFYSRSPGNGATQSSGNSNGVGSTANQNLSGGGGGGYYGGGKGDNSTGGGGGSGYIGGVSDAETIAGNASMPDPDGGTMTGREGNGIIVISW